VNTDVVRRVVGIAGTVTVALAVAACGAESPAGGSGDTTVSTRDLPGVGTVLVDSAGKTLYFTDTDQAGSIKCTADCLELWQPAMAPSDNPTGANELSVVKRPEGSSQLAYQNKPLYTFTMDSADKPASGHNVSDDFGGVNFTWHAVVVEASGEQPPNNGGGYGGGGY
jgi:predicted lipoprotein with Yx(FWY)xxD motif